MPSERAESERSLEGVDPAGICLGDAAVHAATKKTQIPSRPRGDNTPAPTARLAPAAAQGPANVALLQIASIQLILHAL